LFFNNIQAAYFSLISRLDTAVHVAHEREAEEVKHATTGYLKLAKRRAEDGQEKGKWMAPRNTFYFSVAGELHY